GLREFLAARLPAYMVPAAFVLLDALPLTAHGKLDRRALPEPDAARVLGETAFVPPSTPTEDILAAIWSRVLGVDRIGIDDNFFALGGDSIRSIQILALARERGLHFSLPELFQHQTIRVLARELQTADAAAASAEQSRPFSLIAEVDRARMPESIEDAYPLTQLQAGMLFHSEYSAESAVYHNVNTLLLQGRFDRDALHAATRQLTARHAVLRTAFDLTSFSRPLQLVQRHAELPIQITDLRALPTDRQEQELAASFEAERRQKFDWTRAPLIRFQVHLRSDDTFQFSWSEHHAILDGWSVASLLTELFQEYARYGDETIEPPAPPTSSFRDFVALEQAALSSQSEMNFWLEQLRDAAMTRVPRWPDHTADSELDAIDVPIAPELSHALKRVAREAAVPIKTVLLAAHLRVMALLGGSSDVLTGVVSNGRPETADGERVLGLFLNTLPLRQRLSGGTWLELVRATFAAEQQILAHRRYPMAEMQRLLGGQPLFETMFNFVHFHVYERLQGVGQLAVLDSRAFAQTNFTLSADFSLDLTTTDVRLAVSCNPDEIGPEQLHAIATYYAQALTALALTPDSRYETAPLLSAAERQALLHDWNATAVPYPSGTCLHELIEAQVQRTPDAVALVFEGDHLTYYELNRRANQLAHYLRTLGIQPEDRIGICVERSFELIVGVLGILKAGGAYTPIDPTLPIERQRFILEDTRAAVLVTQQRLAAALPEHEAYSVYLDSDSSAIAQMPDTNPPCVSEPDNLAYIIYTSGSTGRPKGVMIPHGNLVGMYSAWEETYQLNTAVRRHLQMANVTFDVFVGDLVRALCSGGTLVLCPRELLLAPDQLYNLIRCEQIDCAEFVPVVLRPLLHYLRESNQLLDGMRLLVCGSDSWSMEEFDQVRQVCSPNTRVVNSFGVTEATIDSTWYDSTQPTCSGDHLVPIGRPFGNTRAYILDQRCQLLPVGVPGELCLGGVGLARGYLNRPDLTATQFIPDPFSAIPGARLYRTGDLARYLPDGTIEFLGRLDHQVKLRGFRIELGEIEATLRQHPAVGEAVVVVREDEQAGDKRLVAYVVENLEPRTQNQGEEQRRRAPFPEGTRNKEQGKMEIHPSPIAMGEGGQGGEGLRAFLTQRLPDYMVPSVVVVLDALPLTPNGKVDRRALPAPEWSAIVSDQPFIAPRTPVEEVVANVWADVLGMARVGRDDNFFALGGHSLLATQVISRLRQTFGIDLPLRSLFDTPTVPGLAEQIEVARRHAEQPPIPPLQPIARDQELPLSFAQQRLWFLDQLNPGHSFYNMYVAVRLTGALDVAAVERSLNAIVQRHEALRTTIAPMNGNPVQVIHADLPISLPIVDLRDLPAAEREAEALRLAAVEGDQPFDLAQGSLLRARLLRLDEEQHIVLLTMHHIVSDGWSMGMLVRELAAFYTAFTATGDSSVSQLQLAPLPIQYADYAAWQRQMLQDQVLDRQLSYWKSQLIDLPILDLPTDRPRPPIPSFQGATELFALDQELSAALLALSRREGVTLFMTLLAGFQGLLARYSGQDDIVVGSPIAGRTRPELEGLIGFFVNMLVLRTDLRDAPTTRQLLARVRETALDAYAHQDLPFEMLVEELQPQRNLSYNPLFQVGFALQNTPLDVLELPGLTIRQIQVSSETARFDLSVFLDEGQDGIGGLIEYNTDLFDGATIRRLIEHFRMLLAGMVAAPDQPVLTLPILSAAEEAQFAAWNTTACAFPPQPVSQIFEAQVARTPDAIAVQFDEQQVSYGELNQRANRLAHYLRALGVGAETCVGLCVERSLDLVVGMLGILKAGGAYVPLDPEYPAERLHFMMEDAQAPVLVTQQALTARLHSDSNHGAQVVCLDQEWPQIATWPAHNPNLTIAPGDLAYVIYTSGSTGRPKGVLVEQRQLSNTLRASQAAFAFTGADRMPCIASFAFDIALFELFCPLLAGGTAILLTKDQILDLPRLAATLETITVLHTLPSLMRQIVGVIREQPRSGRYTRLRQVCVGGDAVPPDLLREMRAAFPQARINVLYGPTEATIICATHTVLAEQPVARQLIGRPMHNTALRLSDRRQQRVPIGVPGEIYIGGASVTRGYHQRPDLTVEKFVVIDGERWYRTGDLARFLPDGTIEFLGRIDDQVKVRGFRIELGEIAATLRAHPAVADAVVLLHDEELPSGEVDQRLLGYVVAGTRDDAAFLEAGQVAEWQQLFDTAYTPTDAAIDPRFNLSGWNSSYTGQPIPADEMRAWVAHTVAQLAAWAPQRVLEIGCGTGLLLFPLAPQCQRYVATDFSATALRAIQEQLR
ncbi:MAG TPA: amino acid adenylation domain-containing protein, partial [Herpetosiphonaceae bacterium]